jgi:enoyl-CoA hydratase/carnithine racemase
MASYETIVLEKDPAEHIARITLNRPERLNAITRRMERELAEALEEVEEDDEMRVLILTGAGRAFCAGADTAELAGGDEPKAYASRSPEQIRRAFKYPHRFILGLQRMEKPTIAMINGPAVGGGFDLACACDIRIGSPNARFMVAFVRIGLFPGWGGTWLYARALGSIAKAAELLFTGDFLEAEEAYKYGLLNKLVPAEELEAATMEMARKIASGPPIAIRLAKLLLYRGLEFDLDTTLKMAAAAETITLTSEDHREGITAWREKRKPIYRGI